MVKESEVFSLFIKQFQPLVENQPGKRIKRWRTDHGTKVLEGDISPDVLSPLILEDALVAPPSAATMALLDLHPPINHGLPAVKFSDLYRSPTDRHLLTVEYSHNCEQYTPHIVRSMLTFIQ